MSFDKDRTLTTHVRTKNSHKIHLILLAFSICQSIKLCFPFYNSTLCNTVKQKLPDYIINNNNVTWQL